MFYFDFTYDIASFDFKSGKVNNQLFSIDDLLYNDWKQMDINAFSLEIGLRFSLFNKKLPVIFR
jgi:hypothetical protein